eukprot:1878035-Alexandrium_andersonii.AAC.1
MPRVPRTPPRAKAKAALLSRRAVASASGRPAKAARCSAEEWEEEAEQAVPEEALEDPLEDLDMEADEA